METIHVCVQLCTCSDQNLFFFKLCRFVLLEPHQVDTLPQPYRLHYTLLLNTTSGRAVYRNLRPKDVFVVHVMDNLKHLVYANDPHLSFWPQFKSKMPSFRFGVRRITSFCAILLYAVRKYGFWVMHPNKTGFLFKVTFLGATLNYIVATPSDSPVTTVCIRDTYSNIIMDRNLVLITDENM